MARLQHAAGTRPATANSWRPRDPDIIRRLSRCRAIRTAGAQFSTETRLDTTSRGGAATSGTPFDTGEGSRVF